MFRGRDILVYWYSSYMPYTELDLAFIDIVGHYNAWPNQDNPTQLVVGGTVPNAGLVSHLHSAGKKIILLIGGADEPDGPVDAGFKALCGSGSTHAQRQAFAVNAWQFVTANGYDGIDLDWEWPGSDIAPAYDYSANYADLIVELGLIKGARTLSVGTTVNDLNGKFIPVTTQTLANLDWYGVQTYGQHGPSWSPHVGHALELHSSGGDNEKHWPYGLPDTQTPSADQAIDYWRSRGVPRSKLVLGIGLYGNSFALVENLYDANPTTNPNVGETDPYRDLKPLVGGWTLQKDEESEAWYYRNPGGQGVISLPVPQTTSALLRLADAERLKGVMIWAASQDWVQDQQGQWHQELMDPLAAESGKLRWIWLSPQKFTVAAGTPSLAARGSASDLYRASSWGFAQGAEHAITSNFVMPTDWNSAYPIRPFLHWTWVSPGDLSDRVNWEAVLTTVGAGEQVDEAGVTVAPAWGAPQGPTAVEALGRTPLGGYTPAAYGFVRVAVRRMPTANPALDYAGAAWLLGVEIQYVATS